MDYLGIPAVAAGGISPRGISVLPKPDVKSVKKRAVRIIRIDCDALVVPVLIVVGGAPTTVNESRPGRALNLRPRRTAVGAAPCGKFATGSAAARLGLDRLHLRVNHVRIARRNGDVNATQLICAWASAGCTAYWHVARSAAGRV